jgi:hypothetical protein
MDLGTVHAIDVSLVSPQSVGGALAEQDFEASTGITT